MIYQDTYDQLIHAGKQIVTHRQKIAKSTIEELILDQVDVSTGNEALMAHLVAESLLKRIDRQLVASKNIYVQQFDIPQTELFYSMAQAVPFVYEGHSLANETILKALCNFESAAVLDIGVGRGQQMKRLVERLDADCPKLKKLSVVGLDPVQQNLEDSAEAIEALRDSTHFDLSFKPLCGVFESLSDADFEMIHEHTGDALAVTSAFSFHHTAHPLADDRLRTRLLRQIHELDPVVLTLVEPNSNHDTEYLPLRIHNAWLHFSTAFALIDESGIEASHKFLIKEMFFGREIRDIFGISDLFRCERHELYENWLLRLFQAGFVPADSGANEVNLPGYCSHSNSDGVVRMDYDDTTVVAVLSFAAAKN